jgi:malonyl-CoA decarboxylase
LRTEVDHRALKRIGRELHACLEKRESEASVRARVAQLATTYTALGKEGRAAVLQLIAAELATPDEVAFRAANEIVAAPTPRARADAVEAARAALEPPWVRLLTHFGSLSDGVTFLADVRADLLALAAGDDELRRLEQDLRRLLAGWLDVGQLELRRVTWDSPASLLEKLADCEAVHAVRGWDDVKNRLDPDRRFFAFFHPRMPEEPLVFVEVALVSGLAAEIGPLLDPDAPLLDPADADTAVFYSISNVQPGLTGISLGGLLIKQVVDRLRVELPRLKTFATLSPIPGFREHLAAAGGLPDDVAGLVMAGGEAPAPPPESAKTALLQLCAAYLVSARRSDGRALDGVAGFHLSNGARIERINWLADLSPDGLRASFGLMVNYIYRLDDIETNHRRYVSDRAIPASSAVEQLARAGTALLGGS